MANLERLKLELNNKEYFLDVEYTVFLEKNLIATDEHIKSDMQIELWGFFKQ